MKIKIFTKRLVRALLTCLLIAAGGLSASLRAQQTTVTGTVTDGRGDPLPGVNVVIKGTATGTSTDINGGYTLNAQQGDVLIFSFIGYKATERTVSSGQMNVTLEEDVQTLGEVVVIGYGETTVKDATGSLTSVTEKDFNKGNIVTPENLLNGRVAGLTVNTGGAPGSGSTIRIRGGSSLDASNNPLFVINGLPIDDNAVGGARSPLSTINPNDIESVTVLKDASATAIYGSRAANGVIIITTKKGTQDFALNVDLQGGVNRLQRKVDVFSADEYRELITERIPGSVDQLGDANTDWQDEIYQDAYMYNANVSASGSIAGIPARLSVGRSDQEGLRLTSRFERNTVALNVTPSLLDDHLKINVNANGSWEKNRFASGQEGNAITWNPTQPVYDPDSPFGGFFQYTNINDDGELNADDLIGLAPFNPVAELLQREDISNVRRFYGNMKFDYNFHFLPEVTATINVGLDDQHGEGSINVSPENPLSQTDGSIVGSMSNYESDRRNSLFDGYLSYDRNFQDLNLDVTAGYSYQKFESSSFTTGELLNDSPDTAPDTTIATDVVLVGFFARANLSFNAKYLLTLSYRRDGTSRFVEDNRWGNFPAVAFAWQLKEDFLGNVEELSSLKLRLGWGITGQQNLPGAEDLYLARYVRGQPASQYQFGSNIVPVGWPQYRNENLKWEETTTWNIGLDYGFLNERFTGSLEFFYKESKDLLANAAISDGSNFSNAGLQNIGDFTSKGIEFSINGIIMENPEGFNWNMNYNVTFIDREINKLALNQDRRVGGIGGGTGGTIQIHRVGYAPFMFYVYNQIYNEEGKPIEGAYADLNGDNQINDTDRYLFRNGDPDVTMGFLSNMNYKNFDLSFNLRASLGNYVYDNVNSSRAQFSNIQVNPTLSNLPRQVLESEFTTTEDVILSDYYIENASFLKMDNLTLGYTFSNFGSGNSSLRLSAGIQNVFTITKYDGIDPEVFGGIDNTIYPRPRTFFLGANVRF